MTKEQVIIVDQNDNQIGIVPRSEMIRKKLHHRASAILVFNSQGELFVHQRSLNVGRRPGYYDLKAGGVVAAGETTKENAFRELGEELGIKNIPLDFLFLFRHPDDQDAPSFQNVFKCVYDGPIKLEEASITQGKFMSFDEIKEFTQKEKFVPEALTIFNKYLEEYYAN
ncbi:NUDIX hydrolase [Nanoarchaeota archaeon]